MLTCREVTEMATDYLDRQLGVGRRFGVWRHLRLCDACRRFFDQMRRTAGLLARVPPQPPPPEVEDRLIAALHSPPADPQREQPP